LVQLKSSPAKITIFNEGDTTTYSYSKITITWTSPSDYGCDEITNYSIKKYDVVSSTFTEIARIASNTFTYTDVNHFNIVFFKLN